MKLHKFTWLIVWLFLIFPRGLAAEKEPKVLVINSDATVEKYKVAQEEFKKAFAHPVLEIDLKEKKWNVPEVEDLLYDEYSVQFFFEKMIEYNENFTLMEYYDGIILLKKYT